jgi:hypothetical protein
MALANSHALQWLRSMLQYYTSSRTQNLHVPNASRLAMHNPKIPKLHYERISALKTTMPR